MAQRFAHLTLDCRTGHAPEQAVKRAVIQHDVAAELVAAVLPERIERLLCAAFGVKRRFVADENTCVEALKKDLWQLAGKLFEQGREFLGGGEAI